MPSHTHLRRSEVYLYFDLPSDAVVVHLMGEPTETRHLIVRDEEVVLSPPWSVHSGCGTTQLHVLLGDGWRESGFRRHASRRHGSIK